MSVSCRSVRSLRVSGSTENERTCFGILSHPDMQAEAVVMLVGDILSDKGKTVHTCAPDDSLADVVDLLVGHNIGSLVVMQDDEMVGIITERDILRASAADARAAGFRQRSRSDDAAARWSSRRADESPT